MEDGERQEAVDLRALDVNTLLGLFVELLAAKTWQYMGLRVIPGTDKIDKNFEKAKLTIDCVVFLTGKLESQLDPEDRMRARSLITDLQMNYVAQLSKK